MKAFIYSLIIVLATACGSNSGKRSKTGGNPLEVKAEISKWKQELLDRRQIGKPCNFESPGQDSARQWVAENPGQLDGLPGHDYDIKSVKADLNGDGETDLLLYFQSRNCTGHNGGTKTYSKIIYSDGTSQPDVISEIIHSILAEYVRKRAADGNLKEVTSDYLETTTTIDGYTRGITGVFRLYTKDDPHCCPSYSGMYTYRPNEKKMELQVLENAR